MTDHDAPASQLWLVRHGETEWSASGRHTSRTDLDLTEAGVEAARSVADKLRGTSFARVLSSPLLRARRTAELAGAGSPDLVEDLHEWDYGDDEGLTTAQIRESRPGWTVWRDGPQGGETCAEVGARGPTGWSSWSGPWTGRCSRSRTGTSPGCSVPAGWASRSPTART